MAEDKTPARRAGAAEDKDKPVVETPEAPILTGTGVRKEERDGEKVEVLTDRPGNDEDDK